MSFHIPFDNSYAKLPPRFYSRQTAVPVATPSLLCFNHTLAKDLGITTGSELDLAQVFSGNVSPNGAAPLAQAYAGHQFGGFSPQLGDGRALLLGEVIDPSGKRRDIQLKGSGPTPYSRRGDGRAWLGPVLREYVVSEAMHTLGIPTTRALAAVTTGENVYREQGPLPGAVLTRVAGSHIRVGTFQYFAARRDIEALKILTDYTITRHYPEAKTPSDLLAAVISSQAKLIAQWMGVGFIHGVMNTDNTTLSGETIDYGPCAFMDSYHPDTVYSSIDMQGRYAYSNQPHVIVWNLAQLATCLVPLMPDTDQAVDHFTQMIHAMPEEIQTEWQRVFGHKIGLANAKPEDAVLINDLLTLMAEGQADFTNTFRALGTDTARDQFLAPAAYDAWEQRWQARLASESAPQETMARANPWVIPRNHRIEEMITATANGDMGPFETLLAALSSPYDDDGTQHHLTRPPTTGEVVQATFCGT